MSAVRFSIQERLPEIVAVLIQKAIDGDMQAASLLMERALPALKPVAPCTAISTQANGTITMHGFAVLEAALAGAIPAGDAAHLLASIGTVARLIETDHLAGRVRELEKLYVASQAQSLH